jgi:hypothetical protein
LRFRGIWRPARRRTARPERMTSVAMSRATINCHLAT